MVIDNTNRMFPVAQPGSYLRSRGLGTMVNIDGDGTASGGFFGTGMTADDIQKLVVGLNAQQLFQINLERGQQGLPPLNPAQYAPGVTVGLNAQTQSFAMLAVAGVLAVMLLKKR